MVCRHCRTEIAEKALICFKCGTATTEALHRGPVQPPRSFSPSSVASLLVLDAIALTGLYLGLTATSSSTRVLGWSLFVVGAVLVVIRVVARRR